VALAAAGGAGGAWRRRVGRGWRGAGGWVGEVREVPVRGGLGHQRPPGHVRHRLPQIKVPACVLWGASDRIVDPEYGLAYATAPGAEFRILPGTGHVPQLETPAPLAAAILGFTAGYTSR
jgi:pimeloyl-ACP methyl ester carboxylesterase